MRLLFARCPTAEMPVVHALAAAGFELMDTFVRYSFDLKQKDIPADRGDFTIRPSEPEDIEQIGRVAAESFVGYPSHFQNDLRLVKKRIDDLYVNWAQNSCREPRLADRVLVAEVEKRLAGFATIKGIGEDVAEGILFGVARWAQGRGLYRSLMIQAMQYLKRRDYARMEVDSQVDNFAVQRVWQRLGFEIAGSGHTFHLWLD